MDRARELKRGGSRHSPAKQRQPKASGHKLLSVLNGGDMEILERSKKERARGSSNEDSELMGGGSEGEEEFRFPSSSCGRRLKLNGKAFDDCNAVDPATVPRRLRSAMNKRNHETSPPLPDANRKNWTFLGTELPHVNGTKRPKLHMKLGGSEKYSKQVGPSAITKDEEEVAEALFALASMVDEPDKSEVDRRAVEAEVPSPLPETRTSSRHPLGDEQSNHSAALKEESTQSLIGGAEAADSKLFMEESTAQTLNIEPVREPLVSERPTSGDQKSKLEWNVTAQVDATGIGLFSKDQHAARTQLNDALNSITPMEVPSKSYPEIGLTGAIQPEYLSTRRLENVSLPAVTFVKQQASKSTQESHTHSKDGAPDLRQMFPNGPSDDHWHLKQTSSTKAGAFPDPDTSASRPGSTIRNEISKEKPVLLSGGRRQPLKRCASHIYISHFINAYQGVERESWPPSANQTKLNEGKTSGITASSDQTVLKTGMNNVMSVSDHGLVADRNLHEVRPGALQNNKLPQEQLGSTFSGIYAQQKQSINFLSLSAGCESTRNPGNGLEPSVQLHAPYAHPLVQHPLMPFSLQHARFSSPYPDQLAAAQQQLQMPQYSTNPYFGPHLAHGSSAKQQLWAAQMAHYGSPHPSKWQNGRHDGSSLNPCSQPIMPPPSSLDMLGPRYIPNPQQLFAVSPSSASSRGKRQLYEEGGTPQLQQLLCNAQNT